MEINFNLNDYVKVKLTDKGKEIFRKDRERLNHMGVRWHFNTEPELDVDGYYKTQLWSLMELFGEHICMGCDVPFDTNIILIKGGTV